jgi:GntR family transcriptional regulator
VRPGLGLLRAYPHRGPASWRAQRCQHAALLPFRVEARQRAGFDHRLGQTCGARGRGLAPARPAAGAARAAPSCGCARSTACRPCLLEDVWLPLPAFAPLLDSDTSDWGDPLYPLYAARCGVRVHSGRPDRFRPADGGAGAPPATAAGHPCAVVQRSAHHITGRCVEARTTHGDANAFHYSVTLG